MTRKNNKYIPHTRDAESGVSEVVGAILLISVVVIAVSVIAVVLFSQQTPQKIPNVNLMVGIDNNVPPTLYLYHNGGDALTLGEFDVYVDGVIKPYSISGGGNEWSLGKNLVVPVSTVPKNVVLVYNGSGTGSVVLRSASVNMSTNTGSISPDVMSFPTPLGICNIGNCSDDEILDAFIKNVKENSIDFYRQGDSSAKIFDANQYYTFKVTDTSGSSSITYLDTGHIPTKFSLSYGDVIKVTIATQNPNNFKTFGLAPSVWELTGEQLYLSIKNSSGIEIGPGPTTKVDLIHTWVTSYDFNSMDSTLVITTETGDTALIVNYSQVINGVNNQIIVLTNVQPCPVGLYLIQTQNNDPQSIYFVGKADSVTVAGTELNGMLPYCPWCTSG